MVLLQQLRTELQVGNEQGCNEVSREGTARDMTDRLMIDGGNHREWFTTRTEVGRWDHSAGKLMICIMCRCEVTTMITEGNGGEGFIQYTGIHLCIYCTMDHRSQRPEWRVQLVVNLDCSRRLQKHVRPVWHTISDCGKQVARLGSEAGREISRDAWVVGV